MQVRKAHRDQPGSFVGDTETGPEADGYIATVMAVTVGLERLDMLSSPPPYRL